MSIAAGIKIKIPTMFQPYTQGMAMVEVGGTTVTESLKELVARFPGLRRMILDGDDISGNLTVILNGQNIQGDFRQIAIKPGDEIYPLVLIEGG
jgi:hypothetical protein